MQKWWDMTQGFEANHSGKALEATVKRECLARGCLVKRFLDDHDTTDLFAKGKRRLLVLNAPYVSIYDLHDPGETRKSRSEMLIIWEDRKIRVECKQQNTKGSVDEKFPYMLLNAREQMPESEVLFVLGGCGAKKGALNWMRAKAAEVTEKKIYVVTGDEFHLWARNELVSNKLPSEPTRQFSLLGAA